jgi:hypothetical protein
MNGEWQLFSPNLLVKVEGTLHTRGLARFTGPDRGVARGGEAMGAGTRHAHESSIKIWP